MENLKDLLVKGEKRALLISATGTGKTYASAFCASRHETGRGRFFLYTENRSQSRLREVMKQSLDRVNLSEYFRHRIRTMKKICCFLPFRPCLKMKF